MRIFYSAENTYSAGIQLYRIKEALSQYGVEMKFAAHYKSFPTKGFIDFNLDSIYPLYSEKEIDFFYKNIITNQNAIGTYEFKILKEMVLDFKPDLIISDNEPIILKIAQEKNIPYWIVSAAMLIKYNQIRKLMTESYYYYIDTRWLDYCCSGMDIKWAKKILFYSPIGDIYSPLPEFKRNVNMVTPYHYNFNKEDLTEDVAEDYFFVNKEKYYKDTKKKFINLDNDDIYKYNFVKTKKIITDGCSSVLADAIYNNKEIDVVYHPTNIESIINGTFMRSNFLSNMYLTTKIDDHKKIKPVKKDFVMRSKYLHKYLKLKEIKNE